MFTGIVEQTGIIQNIEGNRFTVSHLFDEPLEKGASIAVSGACMTVLRMGKKTFEIEMMEESRKRTVFQKIRTEDVVNLERSARIGQRNSGHHVTGHIDQTGNILSLKKMSDFWVFRISVNPKNEKLIVEKGSIAVDGISLTVSSVSEPRAEKPYFEVSILPYTWNETNLHTKKIGDQVNLEFDILGKYIMRGVSENKKT
jgi:riboflavin synthase